MTSLHILVVEDHQSTNQVFTKLLQLRGHHVTRALTVQAALTAAKLKLFDLALLDLGLPDGDGWTLFLKLKELIPDLKAIAVTGYGHHADKERSAAAGFAAHLTKPVEIVVLDREITRIFSGKSGSPPGGGS